MQYESGEMSMKRNNEYLIQRQPKIDNDRMGNFLSISPRIVNEDKDNEEMKNTLMNNKQHANLTSVQKNESSMIIPKARYAHSFVK